MSWRNRILNDFVPQVSKLTLVADPDNLLTEEKLSLELRKRGFDLIEFTDSVEFRYAYESKYRSIWDKGEHTDLVVVLRLEGVELNSLPYDLLTCARRLSFNLGDLFPNLSYPVVEALDSSWLDPLYTAQSTLESDRLGDNATKDFVLRHVFGIAGELVRDEVELLRTLLRIHYGAIQLPEVVADRLVQLLMMNDRFKQWPLDVVVRDANSFFDFLQERWPRFLKRYQQLTIVKEDLFDSDFRFNGPADLPFDHQDIRVYIDNLFLEGKLTPVNVSETLIEADSWIHVGLAKFDTHDESKRIEGLFELVESERPGPEARFSEWTAHAMKWGELGSLIHASGDVRHNARLVEFGSDLNLAFAEWLNSNYASLINMPPSTPAMLHHIPKRLARELEDAPSSRVAMLVLDGMAIDQWVTIRNVLQKQDPRLMFRETAVFAWIPTMTPVSRQALFGAKPPMFFPSTIHTTNNDEKVWKQFWEGCGLMRNDVTYNRGLRSGDPNPILESTIHPSKTRVVGLVVDMVDKMAHHSLLGSSGLHNQVTQWAQTGYLHKLISRLLDLGFAVWLTSDHGNMECTGKGKPAEGVIADMRGERVRVYPTNDLRTQAASKFPFSREWASIGLPPDYLPLMAGGRNAFITEGESIVAHGGLAIEEVIVPLVKLERRT